MFYAEIFIALRLCNQVKNECNIMESDK